MPEHGLHPDALQLLRGHVQAECLAVRCHLCPAQPAAEIIEERGSQKCSEARWGGGGSGALQQLAY